MVRVELFRGRERHPGQLRRCVHQQVRDAQDRPETRQHILGPEDDLARAGRQGPTGIVGEILLERGHGLIDVRRLRELCGECLARTDRDIAAIIVQRHRRIAAPAIVRDVLDETAPRVGAELCLHVGGRRRPVRFVMNAAHVGRGQFRDAIAGLAILHLRDVAGGDRELGDIRFARGCAEDAEVRTGGATQ